MTTLNHAIDWSGRVLTLLAVWLACLFLVWRCFEGLARLTIIGRELRHFVRNRSAFDRWKREIDDERSKR